MYLYVSYLSVWSVDHRVAPTEVGRQWWSPWSWSYRQLLVAIDHVGARETVSQKRSTHILEPGAPTLHPLSVTGPQQPHHHPQPTWHVPIMSMIMRVPYVIHTPYRSQNMRHSLAPHMNSCSYPLPSTSRSSTRLSLKPWHYPWKV